MIKASARGSPARAQSLYAERNRGKERKLEIELVTLLTGAEEVERTGNKTKESNKIVCRQEIKDCTKYF